MNEPKTERGPAATLPVNVPENTDIPELSEAYNHVRKAYGLVSGLLIAWELIGVELEASPIESVKLKLKSPQAAPYVLVALIIYFGFRMTVEWYQTDMRRRQLRASRVDLVVAHAIAIASLILYGYQALSQTQFANSITAGGFLVFTSGVLSGQAGYVLSRRKLRSHFFTAERSSVYRYGFLVLLIFSVLTWAIVSGEVKWTSTLLMVLLCGAVTAFVAMAVVEWFANRPAKV